MQVALQKGQRKVRADKRISDRDATAELSKLGIGTCE
jgi:hypothetical protein